MDTKNYLQRNIQISAIQQGIPIEFEHKSRLGLKSIPAESKKYIFWTLIKTKHFLRDTVLKSVIRKKVVFVGDNSEEAHELLNKIIQGKTYNIVGYLTTKTTPKNIPIRVFGTYDVLETVYNKGVTAAIISISNPELASKVFKYAEKIGYNIIKN